MLDKYYSEENVRGMMYLHNFEQDAADKRTFVASQS
jgi:hypothetical protein